MVVWHPRGIPSAALRAPQTLTGRGRAAPGVLGVPEEAAGHQLLRHPQAQAQVQERGAAVLEIVGDLPELDLGAGQGARDAAGGDGARRAEEGAGRPRRQEECGVRLQRRLRLRGILVAMCAWRFAAELTQYWLCSGRGRNKVSFVTHRAQRCRIALLAAVPELAQAQPGFVGAAGCAVAIFIFADRVVALPRIAGRFGGGDIAPGRACAAWLQVDAPELSSGPIDEIQEVSRVGAQGVTSKSKLMAR